MNHQSIVVDHREDPGIRKVAYAIYILYLISYVFPFMLIVGVVFGYVFENDAKDYLKSHYQYLIRTFWIGLLYFTLAGLSIMVVIGLILIPIALLWWLIRLVKGLKSLMRAQAIEKPKTWIF